MYPRHLTPRSAWNRELLIENRHILQCDIIRGPLLPVRDPLETLQVSEILQTLHAPVIRELEFAVRERVGIIRAASLKLVRIECDYVVAFHDSHLWLVAPQHVVQRIETGQGVHEVDLLGTSPRVAGTVGFIYCDAFERVLRSIWENHCERNVRNSLGIYELRWKNGELGS